jgi:hypothetical protein
MFRFSIRELMLVTMIVALVLGWWVDRQSYIQLGLGLERDRERAIWDAEALKDHLEQVGASVKRHENSLRTQIDFSDGRGMNTTTYFQSKLATSSAPAPNSPKP